jgi:hypothetical protein
MARSSSCAVIAGIVFAPALATLAAAPWSAQAPGSGRDAAPRTGAFAGGPAALAALQQRLGAPLAILQVVVFPDSVEIDARDPREPMHVDRYTYADGRLESPEPVAVGRNERQLRARLFPLTAADLARLPELLPQALEEVRAEEGKVDQITLQRDEHTSWVYDSTSWTKPRFRVHVSGPRSGGYVEFDLDGKRGRVIRW